MTEQGPTPDEETRPAPEQPAESSDAPAVEEQGSGFADDVSEGGGGQQGPPPESVEEELTEGGTVDPSQ